MTKTVPLSRLAAVSLTSDRAIGAVGCCLAVGALTFGVYMNVHGPAASLGTGHDFSVFAQLAPRLAKPAEKSDELDMTQTASIPGHTATAPASVRRGVTLESADADSATIMIAGQAHLVHVGDELAEIGEVLRISPGRHPEVKTSRGLILTR